VPLMGSGCLKDPSLQPDTVFFTIPALNSTSHKNLIVCFCIRCRTLPEMENWRRIRTLLNSPGFVLAVKSHQNLRIHSV
jgi:hypothetical protein